MAKGDADKLRADLDDGYAKIANLLLEALSCAPLTGTEYAVCMFIMRRTYGWAKGENRTSGKSDVIQADEIARGTNTPRSSVHKAIRELAKASIITSELAEAGNIFAHGMNPDIAAWGDGGPDWKQSKVCLREAREAGTYSRNRTDPSIRNRTDPSIRNRTDLYPKSDRGIAEIGQTSIRNRTEVQGTKPCGTGAEGTPTDSIQTVLQTEERQGDTPPLSTSGFGMKRDGAPMILSNYCRLSQAVRKVYLDHWYQARCNDFTADSGWALDTPGCSVTEQDAIDALASDETRPGVNQRGDWWIEQLDKAKRKSRASPPKRLGNEPETDRSKFHEGPLDELDKAG